MRCKECNVDLGEIYTKCPLCGATAVDEAPVLENITTAEYPKYENIKKTKRKSNYPLKHLLRIGGIVSAFCLLIGSAPLWTVIAPTIMIFISVVYFIAGLKEKGELLHSGVALIATFALELFFFFYAAHYHYLLTRIIICLLICAIFIAILYKKYPERMKNQIKALFSL